MVSTLVHSQSLLRYLAPRNVLIPLKLSFFIYWQGWVVYILLGCFEDFKQITNVYKVEAINLSLFIQDFIEWFKCQKKKNASYKMYWFPAESDLLSYFVLAVNKVSMNLSIQAPKLSNTWLGKRRMFFFSFLFLFLGGGCCFFLTKHNMNINDIILLFTNWIEVFLKHHNLYMSLEIWIICLLITR